jgi:hypothetical protein
MLGLTTIVVFLMLSALLVRYLRRSAVKQPPPVPVQPVAEPMIEAPLTQWTALDDHQLDRLLRESS